MTADVLPMRPRRRARRSAVSPWTITGEILVTLAIVTGLFLIWQQWFNDIVVDRQLTSEAATINGHLDATSRKATTRAVEMPTTVAQPANGRSFGVLYVPRFGANYRIPLAGGTTTEGTLDSGRVGHYTDSQMPGQIGNFAIAGHRTTHGAPFHDIANLRVGDDIYIQTAHGWYTYTFRNLQYVKPTMVSILQPIPTAPPTAASTTDRLMTMTSCNPLFSAAERVVAYSVFTHWQPLTQGPPGGLPAAVVAGPR